MAQISDRRQQQLRQIVARRYSPNRFLRNTTTTRGPSLYSQARRAPTAAAQSLRPPLHRCPCPDTSSRNWILVSPNSTAPRSSGTRHSPAEDTERDLAQNTRRNLKRPSRPFAPYS